MYINNCYFNTKKVVVFLFYCIVNIVFYFCIDFSSLNSVTLFSLGQLVFNIIILNYYEKKRFTLSLCFVLFSYIFHCGQLVIDNFGLDVFKPFNVLLMTGIDLYLETVKFFIISQYFLVLGMILPNLINIKNKKQCNIKQNIQKEVVYKTGLCFLAIGIIPRLYIDIMQFIQFVTNESYIAIYELNFSGIFSVFGMFAYYGIILIIIGKQDNKKMVYQILMISAIYLIINMLKGSRQIQISIIITLIFLYYFIIRKQRMQGHKIILSLICGYVLLALIGTISQFRALEYMNISLFKENFIDNLENGVLYNILAEFGGTMISLSYSILCFPLFRSFNYGITYFASLVPVFLPNIFGIFDSWITDFQFIKAFPPSLSGSLGGSYLGELYYNFGFDGVFFAIIIGVVIGICSKKLRMSIYNKNWLQLSYFIILFPSLLLWVRGYVSDFYRIYFWSLILMYLLFNYFKKKNKYSKIKL